MKKLVWSSMFEEKKKISDPWESKWILRSAFNFSLMYIQQLLGAFAVF